jgi:P27 family predicted phage terminase small subunit
MARRSSTPEYRGSPSNIVAGSGFDRREPPRLPAGIDKRVRGLAKDTLAANVHLWDESQIPAILRMCELKARFQEMAKIIDEEGYTVVKQNGDVTKHPLLSGMTATSTAILALETSLCINFRSRDSSVKRAEGVAPPTKATKPAAGERVLRLA